MKSYQVVRTHISPYQHPDFIKMEQAFLSDLDEVDYRLFQSLDRTKDTILITNTHTRLSELPLDLLEKTKLIIHPNSGYDNFAQEHFLWERIPVIIGHEIRAQAVAEYILGCLFEGMLELPQHLAWNKDRNWNRRLLRHQTVHVFGYGHIGKIVADTLKQLGMDVVVIDPFINECPHPLYRTWEEANMETTRAILVCMGLNSTSKKLFNDDFFNNLGEEVLFINAARGALVDEKALKEYLLKNAKSFAFLDVFEKEPFQEDWYHFPQVWKTSHIAGVHQDLDQGILTFEKKVLTDFIHLSENKFNEIYRRELLQNKWIKGALI